MEWGQSQIYYTQQGRRPDPTDSATLPNDAAKTNFKTFLEGFENREGVYEYREQLQSRYKLKQHKLTVDLEHLNSFDADLASALREEPGRMVPIVSCKNRSLFVISTIYPNIVLFCCRGNEPVFFVKSYCPLTVSMNSKLCFCFVLFLV